MKDNLWVHSNENILRQEVVQMAYKIMQGDVMEQLKDIPEKSIQCVVTSPPY